MGSVAGLCDFHCLITTVLIHPSPTHPIHPIHFHPAVDLDSLDDHKAGDVILIVGLLSAGASTVRRSSQGDGCRWDSTPRLCSQTLEYMVLCIGVGKIATTNYGYQLGFLALSYLMFSTELVHCL